jgi:hypothetical protein
MRRTEHSSGWWADLGSLLLAVSSSLCPFSSLLTELGSCSLVLLAPGFVNDSLARRMPAGGRARERLDEGAGCIRSLLVTRNPSLFSSSVLLTDLALVVFFDPLQLSLVSMDHCVRTWMTTRQRDGAVKDWHRLAMGYGELSCGFFISPVPRKWRLRLVNDLIGYRIIASTGKRDRIRREIRATMLLDIGFGRQLMVGVGPCGTSERENGQREGFPIVR